MLPEEQRAMSSQVSPEKHPCRCADHGPGQTLSEGPKKKEGTGVGFVEVNGER